MKAFLLFLFLSTSVQANETVTRPVQINENLQILADSFGRTLYTFKIDANGISKCYNKCAEEWPPILIEQHEADELTAPFGAHIRTNGKIQLTVNNQPLYTYYEDRKITDTLGDGLGGVWFIVEIK